MAGGDAAAALDRCGRERKMLRRRRGWAGSRLRRRVGARGEGEQQQLPPEKRRGESTAPLILPGGSGSALARTAASMVSSEPHPVLSVVVPLFNEEGNVAPLLERIVAIVERLPGSPRTKSCSSTTAAPTQRSTQSARR